MGTFGWSFRFSFLQTLPMAYFLPNDAQLEMQRCCERLDRAMFLEDRAEICRLIHDVICCADSSRVEWAGPTVTRGQVREALRALDRGVVAFERNCDAIGFLVNESDVHGTKVDNFIARDRALISRIRQFCEIFDS